MKLLIMAGGSGTRLWPVSRKALPKQVKPIIGKETLLQITYKRLRRGFSPKDIFISANINQKKIIKSQLPGFPEKHLILEPVRRDTAAAVGLAACHFARINPKEVIVTVNSDHYIENEKEFIKVLKLAGQVVAQNPEYLVLVGLKPTYPETGYGYIKINKLFKQIGQNKIYRVDSFKEKPNLEKAVEYLKNGKYLWNPAYFVFRADKMLSFFAKHLPEQFKILMKIKNNPKKINREFPKIKPISLDYGIMEKTKDLLCLPANFGWADVGHWRTVKDLMSKNDKENVSQGQYLGLESEGNFTYTENRKLIATVGVKNMIIVDTKDAILVCPKDRAQDVKKIVEELKKKKLNKYL